MADFAPGPPPGNLDQKTLYDVVLVPPSGELDCLSICLSVCLHSNRKTARAINTKPGARILYSSRSACIDPLVKRSKVKVTLLQ